MSGSSTMTTGQPNQRVERTGGNRSWGNQPFVAAGRSPAR